jgi:membrane-associated phospholipid phosphatase
VTLPHLVKCKKSLWGLFFVGGAATLIPYQLINRYHLYEPQLLPFDRVDNLMPFWTWTVWIYITEYLFFLMAYFGLKNRENVTRYFYSYMAILIVSLTVFVFYPVTFPRESYPVTGNSFSDWGLTFLRTYMDAPANCLPSLHVSSCFISSLCFWPENRKKAIALCFWSALVSVSTMTTKQHYFIDVWTAFILTMVAFYFFFYRVRLSGTGSDAGASR